MQLGQSISIKEVVTFLVACEPMWATCGSHVDSMLFFRRGTVRRPTQCRPFPANWLAPFEYILPATLIRWSYRSKCASSRRLIPKLVSNLFQSSTNYCSHYSIIQSSFQTPGHGCSLRRIHQILCSWTKSMSWFQHVDSRVVRGLSLYEPTQPNPHIAQPNPTQPAKHFNFLNPTQPETEWLWRERYNYLLLALPFAKMLVTCVSLYS